MSEESPAPARAPTGAAASTRPSIQLLPPNPVFRFYKGGAGIDAFRGVPAGTSPAASEDWVGSTATSFGSDSEGLSTLADGRILRDAIEADPTGFLGPDHVARYGANPAVLVKLLDAGERLAVHFHPGREFAERHLGSAFGKTEAWLILHATPGAQVHLGLRHEIDAETLNDWISEQDSSVMLGALIPRPVKAGDALLVPAGTLHAIGAGITLIELQEPSDMSVVLEWRYAGIGADEATLNLGWDTILAAVDTAARAPIHIPAEHSNDPGSTRHRMLPPEADPYFRADRITVRSDDPIELEPEFAILIATDGELTIAGQAETPLTLPKGAAALIPHAAGRTTVSGSGSAIRCLPPSLSIDPGAGAW